VLTTLTREALPMIRYRTRDLTSLQSPTARSMRRMARITGRSDDMLIIRGVNVFPSQIEALMLKQPALAPHYLLEVTRDAHLDALSVHVECTAEAVGDTGVRDRLIIDLQRDIKDVVGISARVVVFDPGTLERSSGKAKRVVDKRCMPQDPLSDQPAAAPLAVARAKPPKRL
jgi:phenylacetate-CoA ligase